MQTPDPVLSDYLSGCLADLLQLAYAAGWGDGAGSPADPPSDPDLAALIEACRARHLLEVEYHHHQRAHTEPPDWLRAEIERQIDQL